MAEAVVDHLKAIEVKEQNREFCVGITLGPFDGLPEMIHELNTIGKIGERVVKGVIPEFFFGQVTFCNIAKTSYTADRFAVQ